MCVFPRCGNHKVERIQADDHAQSGVPRTLFVPVSTSLVIVFPERDILHAEVASQEHLTSPRPAKALRRVSTRLQASTLTFSAESAQTRSRRHTTLTTHPLSNFGWFPTPALRASDHAGEASHHEHRLPAASCLKMATQLSHIGESIGKEPLSC